MTVRPARLHRALSAAALAVVLPLSACAGTDAEADGSTAATSSAPASSGSAVPEDAGAGTAAPEAVTRIDVRVTGGQVSGDTGRVPIALGEQVTLAITSDVADEAHLHGYDLTANLVPGTPAEITFDATIPGVFEVELHDSGTALLALQVS